MPETDIVCTGPETEARGSLSGDYVAGTEVFSIIACSVGQTCAMNTGIIQPRGMLYEIFPD